MKDTNGQNLTVRKKPQLLHSEIVAKTNVFCVERLDLSFSNGTQVQYERLLGSRYGAVLVVPMLDNETVLLIREYSAGVDRYELALPKGRIEKDEPILEAANREMMEEVGYGARNLHHLTTISQAPSYQNHITHIIIAQDLYPQREEGDEPEEIEVVPWSMAELPALIAHDEFTEARSIAAIYMARDHLITQQG